MSTYAVGDIQGCYQELLSLLDSVKFDTSKDELWVAGDLVNRGPNSLAVLKFLYQHRNNVRIVLGNHDLHLMAVAAGSRQIGKKDNFHSVLEAPEAAELIDWLRQQALFITCAKRNLSMVHAGIPPIWDLKTAKILASEVEQCLKSEHWRQFTAEMYGNEPSMWHERHQGMARLRVITNYFTRMRFCTAEGELEFDEKSTRTSSKPKFEPWFKFENDKLPVGHKILFGHWAALEGETYSDNHLALDTGCVWGGDLTMVDIDTGQRHSCPAIQ